MKKKNRTSIRTLPSWFIAIGSIFLEIFLFGFLLFSCLYDSDEPLSAFSWCMAIFLFGIYPIIIIICMIYRGFYSVVTIDEKGMRRALFGIFCKVSISWDELNEMKCFYRVVEQIFCSKEITIKELTFNEVIKKRKLIQIPALPKVLAVVRQYTDKEIIGIPEEVIQKAIKKYK